MIIKFEDVLLHPEKTLSKLAEFLNTEKSKYSDIAMKKARVPREINLQEREKKLHEIEHLVNNKNLLGQLKELTDGYENSCYGLL